MTLHTAHVYKIKKEKMYFIVSWSDGGRNSSKPLKDSISHDSKLYSTNKVNIL